MDLVSLWFPSHGGCRPNPGQAMVDPNETGVHVHGFPPLFLVLRGAWFPEPLAVRAQIVCASGKHMLPKDLPMDFKDTVPNTSFSLGKPQVADPFDALRQGWS